MISLSEVVLYGADGQQVPIVEALNPGGVYYADREEAASAVDGSTATKWLDANFNGESVLQLALKTGTISVVIIDLTLLIRCVDLVSALGLL